MREYKIDKINRSVVLKFDYKNEIVQRIKQCSFNAWRNDEMKQWIIPVDDYSKSRIIKLIKDFSFSESNKEKPVFEKFDYSVPDKDFKQLKKWFEKKDFLYVPRDYQIEALFYGLQKGNFINGDDVGVGKSWESIMYAEYTNSFPCLVVTPASIKYNWVEVWSSITKGRRSVSVIETKKPNWNADVVVINYDIIGKKQGTGATTRFDELVKKDWKMVIFDEGHFLKEKKSQRAKAAAKIVKKIDTIQLLTGTATMSKPVELWNLLKIIKKDENIAKDWIQFVVKYCNGHKTKFGWDVSGATNIFELNKKLRESCYLRREKREVLNELPEITKQIIQFPITNKKAIEEATENFIQFILETKGEDAADKAMGAEHLVALSTLRKMSVEGKLKAIEQYLKDWKTGGEKLVVFGIHKDESEMLAKKFKCPLISGKVNSKKKQEIKEAWIKSDDVFLFANIQSGGTGVDGLQNVSSNMLFLELPWRPSDVEQAIGRLERSGQKSAVTVTFALSDKTIDKEMWEMLSEKELVTEAVNKGVDVNSNKSGMNYVIKKLLKNHETK